MALRDDVKKQKTKEVREKRVDRQEIKKATTVKRDPPFLTLRVWVNFILSSLQKDRGRIPDNIGSKMLISNNMYITRYYMNSIVQVSSLSIDTPVTFSSELLRYVRGKESDAVIDFTFKNEKLDINLKESGWQTRIDTWQKIIDATVDPKNEWGVSEKDKIMAVRCMYTIQKVKEGHKLYKTRMYITIRSKTGSALTRAEKLVFEYLNKVGAEYHVLVGDVKQQLEYISLLSNCKNDCIKDVIPIITDSVTMSQLLPNSGSMNGTGGSYVGVNVLNWTPFNIDWKKISIARNVYIVAPSGVGKTVLALNLCCSGREDGMAVCVQDIKGNEFDNFIKATGGYIVSLRQEAMGYINSWKMYKEDTDDLHAEAYFRERVTFSKQQMMILSGLVDEVRRVEFEELLESFHKALYTSIGVLANNRNSWQNTMGLHPFKVFAMFLSYMTPEMQRKYSSISRNVIDGLKMYMTREGSKSYIFDEEFSYSSILRAPTLMFDFGILEGSTSINDPVVFKLKFLYMRKLNADYVAYKFSKGIKVLKVLEESQIAVNDPDIMRGYVEEFTLRRAQGQTNVLIGNSVQALTNNTLSQSLVENVTALFVGDLAPKAKKTVIEEFGLEDYVELLDLIGSEPEYKNCFLFVNKMQPRPVIPIVKVILKEGKVYKLLSAVPKNKNAIIEEVEVGTHE